MAKQKIAVEMKPWLKFYGIWIAEVHATTGIRSTYRVYITQKNIRYKPEIEEWIKALGYNGYHYKNIAHVISNKQLWAYFRPLSVGARKKQLCNWVWSCSAEQCQDLLYGLIAGDGSIKKDGTRHYFSSSVKLADDVYRLALHAGFSANSSIMKAESRKFRTIRGEQIKTDNPLWHVSIIGKRHQPFVNFEKDNKGFKRMHYTGTIYSIKVPNATIYVRRNGKAVWTGAD